MRILRVWLRIVDRYNFMLYVLVLVVFITIAGIIYALEGIRAQNAMASITLHRQQVITRSGASSIAGFTNGIGRSLVIMTTGEKFKTMEVGYITQRLERFLNSWNNTPVYAVSFVDKNGIVQANVNNDNISGVGVNVSDRDYHRWALTAMDGEYHVSPPVISRFGVTKDKFVIPIASPVFNSDGEYSGEIVAAIIVDELVRVFSDPLKISDLSKVFLLDSDGNMVFSSFAQLKGVNIKDIFNGFNFPGKSMIMGNFIAEFESPSNEGKFDVVIPELGNQGKLTRYLIAYTSVNIDNKGSWTLIGATPASEAFLFSGPFYREQLASFLFLVFVIVVFCILGITSRKVRLKS